MAGTNDPSDPAGKSGRKHPPVLDLSASEVEPRKSGATGPDTDAKASKVETGDTDQKGAKGGDKDVGSSAESGAGANPPTAKPDETKAGGPKGEDASKGPDISKDATSAGPMTKGSGAGGTTSPSDADKAAAPGGTAGRGSSPVPSVGPVKTGASAKASDAPKTDTAKAGADAGAPGAAGEAPAGPAGTAASATHASDSKQTPPAGGSTGAGGDDRDIVPPPSAQPSGGIGLGGAIFTAVIAAVLVVGAGYIAIDAGLLGAPGSGPRTVAQGGAPSLEGRIAALENQVEAAGSGAGSAAGALGSLQSDVEDLKSQVEGLGTGLPDRVTALESRFTDLADAQPAITPGDIQSLRDSVSQASQSASQAATAAGNAATEAGKANAAIGPIQQSIESLRTAQASLQSSMEQLSGTVSDLSGRVQQLETIVGGTGPREVAALALSTAVLDEQLRNGEPFGPALAAVKTRLEDPSLVAPLDAYAETGLPTRRELVAAFPQVEASIRDSVRGEAQEEGLVAGLLANAESLVRVRRTDAPDEGGVNATLDQIRADLGKGNLAAAADDWTRLPEPAQAASKDWHDQVAARVAADALVDKVTGDVLASLSEDPSAAPQTAPADTTAPGN